MARLGFESVSAFENLHDRFDDKCGKFIVAIIRAPQAGQSRSYVHSSTDEYTAMIMGGKINTARVSFLADPQNESTNAVLGVDTGAMVSFRPTEVRGATAEAVVLPDTFMGKQVGVGSYFSPTRLARLDVMIADELSEIQAARGELVLGQDCTALGALVELLDEQI